MFWNTVSPLLTNGLRNLMQASELTQFRLVGGTALSLYLGHRMSIDIDLFTDAPYESVDFAAIESYLRDHFGYIDKSSSVLPGMGRSYFIGDSSGETLKLDVYYTDPFIEPVNIVDNIRIATIAEITAMKVDVVCRDGRKKDFWDIHELLNRYSIDDMISLHAQRYPYTHDRNLALAQFKNFNLAEEEFDPNCLRGKYWELIKYEIIEAVPKS